MLALSNPPELPFDSSQPAVMPPPGYWNTPSAPVPPGTVTVSYAGAAVSPQTQFQVIFLCGISPHFVRTGDIYFYKIIRIVRTLSLVNSCV